LLKKSGKLHRGVKMWFSAPVDEKNKKVMIVATYVWIEVQATCQHRSHENTVVRAMVRPFRIRISDDMGPSCYQWVGHERWKALLHL